VGTSVQLNIYLNSYYNDGRYPISLRSEHKNYY